MSDDKALAIPQQPAMLELIGQLARDPAVDHVKLEALLRMKRQLDEDQAKAAFFVALNAAQGEIDPVARNVQNTQTKSWYAELEKVEEAIRPVYTRHGFSVSYSTVAPLVAGNVRVEARVARAGHVELYYREAGPDTLGPKGSPVKTVLHGTVSTETLLKRYLVCGIFNVVFLRHDDDGVRGGRELITNDQLHQIQALVSELGVDTRALCERFGIESLADLERPAFVPMLNMLISLRERRAERAE